MTIKILGTLTDMGKEMTPAFFEERVAAGFPSVAEDYFEQGLNLQDLLVKHPAATFFIRVEGDSMIDANIYSGDILIVDRALDPENGKIIVAFLNGAFTVKRLIIRGKKVVLAAENPRYPSLEVTTESDFRVWGIVTYVIHRAR